MCEYIENAEGLITVKDYICLYTVYPGISWRQKMDGMSFLTLVVISFALVMLALGIFSIYFGSGRSRVCGEIMVATGFIVGTAWVMVYSNILSFYDVTIWDILYPAIINITGIAIGALAAIIIFLATVLKN